MPNRFCGIVNSIAHLYGNFNRKCYTLFTVCQIVSPPREQRQCLRAPLDILPQGGYYVNRTPFGDERLKVNYQKEMEAVIAALPEEARPSLLLQCCCAPCSSAVLEVLCAHFDVSIYFYNPNIHPRAEYEKRLRQFDKLLPAAPFAKGVRQIRTDYDPAEFFDAVKGLEAEPEGGARCAECFRLRLRATAEKARALGFDFFTTTLTVSPHKDAAILNELGKEIGEAVGVRFLPSDFKKKEGYKRSIALSKAYDLYRQTDCGCIFSKREESGDENFPASADIGASI